MIDSYFRNPFQKLSVDPLLKVKWITRIPPTLITFLSLFSGIFCFFCILFSAKISALFFLFLSGFFDVLDGSIARFANKTSDRGAAFDLIFDRLIEFLIIFALFLMDPSRGIYCLLMLGSTYLCVTSFFIVGLFSQNESEKSFFYSPGLIERSEAFVFFGLLIFFPKAFAFLSLLFSALVFLTASIRIYEFQRNKN